MRTQNSRWLLETQPSVALDTRGQICPYPMVETRKLSEKMGQDDVAEIITDVESTAKNSIPLVCESLGLDYVVIRDNEFWRVKISKKGLA